MASGARVISGMLGLGALVAIAACQSSGRYASPATAGAAVGVASAPAPESHDPSMEEGRPRKRAARLRQSSYEPAPMSGVDAGCDPTASERADAGPISCEMPAGGT